MKNRPLIDRESFRKLQEKRESLRKVESFPYSEDLESVMDTDVYTCHCDSKIKAVVKKMTERNISSAIVVDDQNLPVGILTERDIMRRIIADGSIDISRDSISKVMTPEPVTLTPRATIYRALSVLSAKGIKHLPLIENSRVVGIVTLRRLLKLRYPEPMALIEAIQDATDVATLRAIKNKLPAMAATRLDAGRRAYDIVVMLSLINRDIHCKAMELAMRELGEPPAPFCLFVTGSHGRLENLLTPDQDHGMIIADNEKEKQYDQYYVDLSVKFSQWLNEIGFATCPGYIMCANPLWRKSLGEWKLQLRYWYEKQVPEVGRFTTILFDAAPIFGEYHLFQEMNTFAHAQLGSHHEVLRVLHEEEGQHKAPLGLLGRFITEPRGEHRGEFDIKRSGLIFMVEGIRILALLHGIRETATLKRIGRLISEGFIHKDDGEYFEAAYLFLLHLALKVQTEKALQGRTDTFINPKKLSRRDRETLHHAFKAITSLQSLVASEFGELVL